MKYNALHDAGRFSRLRRNRKRWQKVVSVMASIVVFCTTYALILPAITMEQPDTYCGLENHIHGPECYEKVLICDHASDDVVEATPMANVTEGHTHDETCYEEIKTLICEQEEVVGHKHDSSCETLICSLEETSGHSHSDACYEIQYETKTWTEEVTVNDGEELTCTSTEEGHAHDGSCYTAKSHTETVEHTEQVEVGRVLTCTTPESAPHSHDASCYQMVCTQEEVEGHTHTDACYTVEQGELICEIPEVTEAPETTEPEVTDPAEPAHEHSDACYEEKLICGCEIEHEHTADCYIEPPYEPADNEALVCELEEHKHDDACLIAETGELICDLEEHSHDENCYEQLPAFEMWLPLDADIDLDVYTEKHEYIDEDGLYGVTVYAKPDTFDLPVTLEVELLEEDDDRYVNALDVLAAQVEETEEAEEEIVDEAADELAAIDEVTPENTLPEEPAEPISEAPVAEEEVVEEEIIEEEVIEEEITAQPALTGEEGMIAFDIHFVDEDGDEVQPLEPVYVHIQAMGLLPEDVDLSTVTVQHIREEQPATFWGRMMDMIPFVDETVYIPEVVADMIDEDLGWIDFEPNTDDDEIYDVNAAFEVDGFSTFTITWSGSNSRTIYMVDTAGNSIGNNGGSLNLTSPTDVGTIAADMLSDKELTDQYKFEKAVVSTANTYNPSGNNNTEIDYLVRNRSGMSSNRWRYSTTSSNNYTEWQDNQYIYFIFSLKGQSIVFKAVDTYGKSLDDVTVGVPQTDTAINTIAGSAVSGYELYDAYLADGTKITTLRFENDKLYANGNIEIEAENVTLVYSDGTFRGVTPTGVTVNVFDYENDGVNSGNFLKFLDNGGSGGDTDNPNNWTQENGGVVPGIVSANLGTDGFPTIATKFSDSNQSLNYLFNPSTTNSGIISIDRNADYLFVDQGNGRYVYDSGVNAAQLDVNGDFFLYEKAATNSSDANFMPYDDYNQRTNYHFGMHVSAPFLMPADGLVNGEQMIFRFNGDDDVWVFIDEMLILDMGGIHSEYSGYINFATGEVYIEAVNSGTPGDSDPATTTLEKMIRTALAKQGMTEAQINTWIAENMTNSKVDGYTNNKIFKDYTKHTLDMFYLERGAGGSNCMIDFNLQTVPENSLLIRKEMEGVTVKNEVAEGEEEYISSDLAAYLKNLSFDFRIVDENGDLYEKAIGKKYVIRTTSGTEVESGVVGENGIVTIKPGQMVAIEGLTKADAESNDVYFVQELINANQSGQYYGVKYEVTAGEGSDGIVKNGTVVEGSEETFKGYKSNTLYAKNSNTVLFTNLVDVDKLNAITVQKTVVGNTAQKNGDYTMNVEIGGTPVPVGTEYKLFNIVDGEEVAVDGTHTVETAGKVTLKHNQVASFLITTGSAFEVTEDAVTMDAFLGESYEVIVTENGVEPETVPGNSGTVDSTTKSYRVIVTNEFDVVEGSVAITKNVVNTSNPNATPVGEFTFKVELPAATDETLVTVVYPDSENAVVPEIKGETGARYIEITLEHGQTVTINGLPGDETVVVTETTTDGYSVKWETGNGTPNGTAVTMAVVAGETVSATCINTTGYALPSTGGIGTTLYTMSGMAMMSAALVGGYGLRRKRERGSEE